MPATPFILFLLSVTGEHRDNVFQKRSTTKKMALVCKSVTCLRTSLATAAKRILNFATPSNKQSTTFWKKFEFQRMTIRRHMDSLFLKIADNLRIDFCEWKYSISTLIQSSKRISFEVSKNFFLQLFSRNSLFTVNDKNIGTCAKFCYMDRVGQILNRNFRTPAWNVSVFKMR